MHVDRELRAVAGRQIAIAARRDRLVVDGGAGRRGPGREHPEPRGLLAVPAGADAVAAAWPQTAEEDAAERVRALLRDRLAAAVQQLHRRPRRKPGRIDLPGAAVGVDCRLGGAAASEEHDRNDGSRDRSTSPRKYVRNSSTPKRPPSHNATGDASCGLWLLGAAGLGRHL